MPHHESDVVQMRGHAQRAALSAEIGDHAALVRAGIGAAQLVEHGAEQILDLAVLPGRAVHGEQTLKGVQTVSFVKTIHVEPPLQLVLIGLYADPVGIAMLFAACEQNLSEYSACLGGQRLPLFRCI